MPAAVVLLHNPRCSKSRAAKALLEERAVPFTERRYLETPLTRAELEELAAKLGLPARDWVRRGEDVYAEAGLGPTSSEAEILDAMARFPILVERPVLIAGGKAVIGRPPARVLEIL